MLISEMWMEANCLEEEKHGSWTGARRSDGSRRRLRIWGLALWFNWYRDNVPRFPGTLRTLHPYLFCSELWLARPLFRPAQLIPQVSHPQTSSCPPPNPLQAGRLTPYPHPHPQKIDNPFGHHVCPGPTLLLPGIFPSVLFSVASMACTILFQSWLNICPPSCACLGMLLWSPLHSAWMTNQENKAYLYIVEYSKSCSPIRRCWLDIEDASFLFTWVVTFELLLSLNINRYKRRKWLNVHDSAHSFLRSNNCHVRRD